MATRDSWEIEAHAFFKEHPHLQWFFRDLYPGEQHELVYKEGIRQRLVDILMREDEDISICILNLWPGAVFRLPVVTMPDGTHAFRNVGAEGKSVHDFPWNMLQAIRHHTKEGREF